MITINNITKSFGSLQVLKGISLHINKGEVVSIVGPSGAGKTTLLQIMGTLDRPDQGEIVIEKKTKRGIGQADIRPAIRSIRFESAGEDIRLHAVISAQEPTLNPDLLPSALRQLCPELAPDFAEFTRLETYDAEMRIYR